MGPLTEGLPILDDRMMTPSPCDLREVAGGSDGVSGVENDDVKEVLRRWQAGTSIRAIANEGIADRKTVTRYIKAAVECDVDRSAALDEEVIQRISRSLSGHLEGRPWLQRTQRALRAD